MNSNTQDSNVELASFYQNTQNGPIDTSNAPIEELNNSRTKERLLEAYFVMIVQKNFAKVRDVCLLMLLVSFQFVRRGDGRQNIQKN